MYGKKFRVVTDHLPLAYMFKNQIQEGRFAKWIALLAGMDFTVEYRLGRNNANADCLSRLSVPSSRKRIEEALAAFDVSQWEEKVRWHEFAHEQRCDPLLKQRIDFIEQGIVPHSADLFKHFCAEKPRYAMRDGVLVHITKWGKASDPTIYDSGRSAEAYAIRNFATVSWRCFRSAFWSRKDLF